MKSRVYLIHGWQGSPNEGWRPWFKKQIEKEGFEVVMPAMPDPAFPKQSAWVNHLQKIVSDVDGQCYFIGHSLGCIAILRYLESLEVTKKVGGVILVAGFNDDLGIQELSDFFKDDINWEKIKSHTDKFVTLVSDDDPYDLAKYNGIFKKVLNADAILVQGMRHFSAGDGITEAPVILSTFLKMIKGR